LVDIPGGIEWLLGVQRTRCALLCARMGCAAHPCVYGMKKLCAAIQHGAKGARPWPRQQHRQGPQAGAWMGVLAALCADGHLHAK